MSEGASVPRAHRRRTHQPLLCPECRRTFTPKRSDQLVCSARCRRRKHDREEYTVTQEDRAAIARVRELVPCPVPLLVWTDEQRRAYILATAVREGD